MSASQDRQQLQELQARLSEAEDQLELVATFLNSLPDFFYVHNWNLEFQYANTASHALWNLPPGSLIGKRYSEVDSDPEQAQRIVDICREVMRAGEIRRVDGVAFTMPDGSKRILTQFNVPFKHPKTGEPMLLGMARDSTAEHELIQERLRRQTLERDLQIAQSIQRSILPTKPPRLLRYEIAASMRPSAFASGDFFDWWHAPQSSGPGAALPSAANTDSATLVCLGDVTGHGIGPALLAAATRAYCRAIVKGGDHFAPSLSRLAQVISSEMTDGRFVTLAAAVLDDAREAVQVLSAGHGPILHHRVRAQKVEEISSHAPPLGVDELGTFEPQALIDLQPGERLFLLSDGIPEASNARGTLLGVDAVKDAILAMPGDLSSASACEQLLSMAQSHSGRPLPSDDMTALVIRRLSV